MGFIINVFQVLRSVAGLDHNHGNGRNPWLKRKVPFQEKKPLGKRKRPARFFIDIMNNFNNLATT
jgi:hypothetical protein